MSQSNGRIEAAPGLTGVPIETATLNLFNDSRILEGTTKGGVATLKIQMKETDVGGILEAGTTPGNIGGKLYTAPVPILPEANQFRFIVEDKSGVYFGSFLYDRSDLIAIRTTPTNHPQIVNSAKDVHLTALGLAAAETFCKERHAEAARFCDTAFP